MSDPQQSPSTPLEHQLYQQVQQLTEANQTLSARIVQMDTEGVRITEELDQTRQMHDALVEQRDRAISRERDAVDAERHARHIADTARNTLDALQGQYNTLAAQVAALQAAASSSGGGATTAAAAPSSGAAKTRYATPDAFDGTLAKGPTFRHQFLLYFKSLPREYTTDDEKINFVLGYMKEGKAAQFAERATEPGARGWASWTDFLADFEARFVTRDRQLEARNNLDSVAHTSDLETFITEFELVGNRTGFGDAELVDRFVKKLKPRYIKAYFDPSNPTPATTLDDAVTRVRAIDNSFQSMDATLASHSGGRKDRDDGKGKAKASSGGGGTRSGGGFTAAPPPAARAADTDAMQVDSSKGGGAAARFSQALCKDCGELGHYSKGYAKCRLHIRAVGTAGAAATPPSGAATPSSGAATPGGGADSLTGLRIAVAALAAQISAMSSSPVSGQVFGNAPA